MPRVGLLVYVDPGEVQVFINIKRRDGTFERLVAMVDTGAEVSLLPARLLNIVEYRVIGQGTITVEQAGITRQSFTATEALVTLFLEDQHSARTRESELRVWFADARVALIGFDGVLDRAALHLDMRQMRTGWIELD